MKTASPLISLEKQEALLHFVETHPMDRVSRNLRRVLVQALESDGFTEALDFKEIVHDLDGLFLLLDSLAVPE